MVPVQLWSLASALTGHRDDALACMTHYSGRFLDPTILFPPTWRTEGRRPRVLLTRCIIWHGSITTGTTIELGMANILGNGDDFSRIFLEDVMPCIAEMVFDADDAEMDYIVETLRGMPPEFWWDMVKDCDLED